MQYIKGTVAFVQDSPYIVGTGTDWDASNVKIGHEIHHASYPLVPYIVGYVDYNTQQITLTTNYAGASDPLANYVVASEYTTNIGLPEPAAGDLDIPALITRAFRKIDSMLSEAGYTTTTPGPVGTTTTPAPTTTTAGPTTTTPAPTTTTTTTTTTSTTTTLGPTTTVAPGTLMAFPGAEGFGAETPHGSGRHGVPTTVIKVTTLDQGDVAGSLRRALSTAGPRIIVFEVSGVITLTTDLRLIEPYCWVAGQTAPDPGITIRGKTFIIDTHNVLIQHIKVRPGDINPTNDPNDRDGFRIMGDGGNTQKVIIDHCSVTWSVDENINATHGINNCTLSNCLVAECLFYPGIRTDGEFHSMAMLLRSGTTNFSSIRNLFIHNADRNPRITDGTSVFYANNITYNHSKKHYVEIDGILGSAQQFTAVNNNWIAGANTIAGASGVHIQVETHANSEIYQTGNILTGTGPMVEDDTAEGVVVTTPAIWDSSVTLRTAAELEAYLVPRVGARAAVRDDIDSRIISEFSTRTGVRKNTVEGAGGWDLSSGSHSLTPPTDVTTVGASGYLLVEEWVHGYSALVEVAEVGASTTTTTSGPTTTTTTTTTTASLITFLFDERFESGYDEVWSLGENKLDAGSSLNEDAPSTWATDPAPFGWGAKCLRAENPAGGQCWIKHQPSWSGALHFRLEHVLAVDNMLPGEVNRFFSTNVGSTIVFMLEASREAVTNNLRVRFNINNDGSGTDSFYFYIENNVLYRHEVKYDMVNDLWEWKVNGVTQASGSLSGTHPTTINNVFLGSGLSSDTPRCVHYFDRFGVSTDGWIGDA